MESNSYLFDQVCRGAVALNNVGVSMSKQGQHFEAHSTFKDALALLKFACVGTGENGSPRVITSVEVEKLSQDISEKVHRANFHLMSRPMLSCQNSNSDSLDVTQIHAQLGEEIHIPRVQSENQYFMIKLDGESFQEYGITRRKDETTRVGLEASVIMYNMAVLQFFFAKNGSCPRIQSNARSKAMHLFKLSRNALGNAALDASSFGVSLSATEVMSAMCSTQVEILILQSLIPLMNAAEVSFLASQKEYVARLKALKYFVSYLRYNMSWLGMKYNASAAAA